MNLYLVQHGKPVPKEKNPDRPLSEAGRADVESIARLLNKAGIKTESIFHSGKTRALETAKILSSILEQSGDPLKKEGLAPLDDVYRIAEKIQQTQEDLMIVGHLPHLAKLAALLVTGNESSEVVTFQQGGIVCLQRDEERKNWTVAWMLVPEILR